MFRLSDHSLWIEKRAGSWVRVPTGTFLLPPLFLLTILVGTALSVNRSEELFLWFLAPHPAAKKVAAQSFLEANLGALENLWSLEQPVEDSSLPTLDIFAEDDFLAKMFRAKIQGSRDLGRLPGGDRPAFDAYYIDESGKLQKAEVSLRGWGVYHHSVDKPSLRVRIRVGDVALGERFVELQRPEEVLGLTNYLPEQVALKVGAMTALSDYVRVFMNKKYKGVYLRTVRPGESLALALGKLPGPFFKGDALGSYQGADLWSNHEAWRVFGKTARGLEYFDQMLGVLRQPKTASSLTTLSEYLDFEAFARWNAVMVMIGSAHTDNFHNQVLFLNPLTGRFEPVLWDPVGLGGHLTPHSTVDRIPNHLIDWMYHDPRWVHQRNLWLHRLVDGVCDPKAFAELVEETYRKIEPDLKADPFLAQAVDTGVGNVTRITPVPASKTRPYAEATKRWMEERAETVRTYLDSADFSVLDSGTGCLVSVFGNVAVTVQTPKGEQTLFPGKQPGKDVAPESGVESTLTREPAVLTYRLPYSSADLQFKNAVTGQPLVPKPESSTAAATATIPAADFPKNPQQQEIVLGPGLVKIDADLTIAPSQSLRVLPGTTLSVKPGVSLISMGRTTMRGTKAQPIVIKSSGDQPWGCLAVVGPASKGSQLEHLRAAGGSLGSLRGIDFKGMVNVYDCPDLKMAFCTFGANLISDDAVNVAGSTVKIEHCLWNGAASDGLDLDMCQGEVVDCLFENTGNDGLDLSTCRLTVSNCRFLNCGDKGISVGEGTHLLVRDSQIQGCQIGSQVKDDSRAFYENCQLTGNGIGLDAYRKKWLFQMGGSLFLKNTKIVSSKTTDLQLDPRSQAAALASQLVVPPTEKPRFEEVSSVPASWSDHLSELSQ